jgi:hypothetical protein
LNKISMKKNCIRLSFLFLVLLQFPVFAQQAKKTESLLKKNNWLDFVIIKIDQYEETQQRYEVDVVYLKDKNFKIHAAVNSNMDIKKFDTVFVMNTAQLSILENFYDRFQRNDFLLSKNSIAGSRGTFSCTVDGETVTVENKSKYSLVEELLKK